MNRSGGRYIKASEVNEYCYCSRQWHLKQVKGIRPPLEEAQTLQKRLAKGEKAHNKHSRTALRSSQYRGAATWAWVVAGAAITLTLILWGVR